ncbi:MAG TPA: BRO family protein [Pseudogracilibacillus sp.]|nr:BRO family protein [Pseudogracilibacillus sp.]
MNLSLAVKEMFEGNEVEIYQLEDGSPVMTIDNLAKSLEYASKSGVENIINRNEYLKDVEFSSTHKMWVGNSEQETRIFNEDGIYEITMLSKKPKAREFRAFVRKLLKDLRKGNLQVVQPQSDYDKLQIQKMNAESRLMNARTRQAKLILDMQKNNTLSPVAVELLGINALEVLTDKDTDYRPQVEKTYTATEIAKEIGITANKVGRIANANNLKTEEYGIEVLDKSRSSNKQVSSFRYNEKGKQKIKELA